MKRLEGVSDPAADEEISWIAIGQCISNLPDLTGGEKAELRSAIKHLAGGDPRDGFASLQAAIEKKYGKTHPAYTFAQTYFVKSTIEIPPGGIDQRLREALASIDRERKQ